MTKKSVARLHRDAEKDSAEKAKVLEGEALEELIEAREKSLMASVEAQEADAQFRRLVAVACRELGVPIERSILCLTCGMARETSIPQCPSCGG